MRLRLSSGAGWHWTERSEGSGDEPPPDWWEECFSTMEGVCDDHVSGRSHESRNLLASQLCDGPVRTTARKEHQSTHQCDDCSVINPVVDSKMT